jgi:hypothetical protein
LLKEGVDFGFLEEENVISFMVFFLVGGKATHVIYQPRQRSIEQVVTRQKASHVSDRRLEEAHGLVVRTDTPVDVGDVIHDLVDDIRELHDQGGRQSVDCRGTPAITVWSAVWSWNIESGLSSTHRELLDVLLTGDNSSSGNAYLNKAISQFLLDLSSKHVGKTHW